MTSKYEVLYYMQRFWLLFFIAILCVVAVFGCDQSSSATSTVAKNSAVAQNTVYIRDDGKRVINLVDTTQNRVVQTLNDIGGADFERSMAVAPNGKLYILRAKFGGGSYNGRALLIIDPNRNWQRKEISMLDDVSAIAISPDGRAFINHEIVQPDRTFKLDIFDTTTDKLITTLRTPGRVDAFVPSADGVMYFFQEFGGQKNALSAARLRGLRTSDLQQVVDIPLPRYHVSDIALGRDGMLYVTVNMRARKDITDPHDDPDYEQVGLLLVVDPKAQRVVVELPLPRDPYRLIVTSDNKAYITHYDTLGTGETNSLSIYDLKAQTLLKQGINVGKWPVNIAQVSINKIYGADHSYTAAGAGRIYVVDTQTDTITGSFSAGDYPNSIAVPPAR